MKKIRLLIVTLFAFLLFIPLVGCSHDSSGGSGEVSKVQASYSSSHLVDFVWTSESGETFTFYDDGTYCYDNGSTKSWGTYKDTNGNFALTGDDGSGFYFEISDGSATVYETEKGKKKEGEGTSFKEINPSCCTVAEAAKYISVLTGDTTYTFVAVDNTETSCSALKTALNGLSSTESVGPYVSLDLTGATQLEIDYGAFRGSSDSPNYSLREIKLPANCTSIGDYAFSSCLSLTNIVLPETLETIEGHTFSKCTSLTSIDMSKTQVTEIPDGSAAFYVFGDQGVFARCTSLTTVTLPSSITKIGDYAFQYCTSLTTINLVNTKVKSIGYQSFSNCDKLESVGDDGKFPESLTEIYSRAFSYCAIETFDLSSTKVKKISEDAFWACESLKSILLPETLTEIGDFAFETCSSLENINLSNTNVEKIGEYAFASCKSLESILLPKTLTEIVDHAFNSCSSLATVNIENETGTSWSWGHPSSTNTSQPEPNLNNLEIVEDFEDYAAYYLTGNSSAKGSAATSLNGLNYYWYKVSY